MIRAASAPSSAPFATHPILRMDVHRIHIHTSFVYEVFIVEQVTWRSSPHKLVHQCGNLKSGNSSSETSSGICQLLYCVHNAGTSSSIGTSQKLMQKLHVEAVVEGTPVPVCSSGPCRGFMPKEKVKYRTWKKSFSNVLYLYGKFHSINIASS